MIIALFFFIMTHIWNLIVSFNLQIANLPLHRNNLVVRFSLQIAHLPLQKKKLVERYIPTLKKNRYIKMNLFFDTVLKNVLHIYIVIMKVTKINYQHIWSLELNTFTFSRH